MLKKLNLKVSTFVLFIFCMNISIGFADDFDFQFDNVLNLVENNEKDVKVDKENTSKKQEISNSDLVSFNNAEKGDVKIKEEEKERLAEQKRLEKESKKEEKKRLAEQKRLDKQKAKEEKKRLAEQKKLDKQKIQEQDSKKEITEQKIEEKAPMSFNFRETQENQNVDKINERGIEKDDAKLEKQQIAEEKKRLAEQKKLDKQEAKKEKERLKEQKKLEKQQAQEEKKKLKEQKEDLNVKLNDSDKIDFNKNYTNIVDMKTKKVLKFNKKYIYKDINYKDNNYIPSGFMGDYGDLRVSMRCYVKPYKGMSCMKLSYSARDSQGNGWAGIYWQEPANNWGTENKGLNLSGAKKLVFYIKGEKGGEIIDKIKIGGIQGEFSDTADIDFGPIILSKKWEKYVIDLKGYDLSSIIGGFAFVSTSESNPEGVVFYLDEIFFE